MEANISKNAILTGIFIAFKLKSDLKILTNMELIVF